MLVLFLFFSPAASNPPWPSYGWEDIQWKANYNSTISSTHYPPTLVSGHPPTDKYPISQLEPSNHIEIFLKRYETYWIPSRRLRLFEPGKQHRFESDHVVVGQRQRLKPDQVEVQQSVNVSNLANLMLLLIPVYLGPERFLQ